MRKLLTLILALLAGPVFAQSMGQVGGLNVPSAAGSSGTVTSVACPSATITTSGTCNPLAAGATTGQVVTASGSTGATTAQTGLVFTGGNSLQVGNGSNAGTVFLDTTGGGGVNLLAGSSASTFSATLPDNTGTVAELNVTQSWTAFQSYTTGGIAIGASPRVAFAATAIIVSAGGIFGTAPSISANGSVAANITVGSSPAATVGSITLTSSTGGTGGWHCSADDITTLTEVIHQTANSATSAGFIAYAITTGAATAPTAGDHILVTCTAY